VTLVVDASVAVKWVLPEPGSDQAAALRLEEPDVIAPSLVVAEIGNALWKSVSRKDLSRSEALDALRIATALFSRLVGIEDLAADAMALATDGRHPIYDCFYLALARRENAVLVTADEDMIAAARKAKIKVRRL
jgi:predicted nucleic acid-binding protein